MTTTKFKSLRPSILPLKARGQRLQTLIGFTLTEVAIVLAIAGVLIGSVFSASSAIKVRAETTNAINLFRTISGNMTDYMKSGFDNAGGTGAPDITNLMIAKSVIPEWAVTPGNTHGNTPWATSVNGGQSALVIWFLGNRLFRVSMYGVPRSACIELLMNVPACTSQHVGCAVNVTVNSGIAPGNTYVTTGMTLAKADDYCARNAYSANNLGTTNSVEFDYPY
jgi:hypothetical protein